MHGLINRAIQCFLRDTYGVKTWSRIAREAKLGFDNFEALLVYEPEQTEAVLTIAATHVDNPREMLLEDLGTYLVSHPNVEAVRRLLRFGGASFVDFLHSLDELPDRARLAVPDLELPQLELQQYSATAYGLTVTHKHPGFGHVLVGILRTMADDYGVLAFSEFKGRRDGVETLGIELLEMGFAEGRDFELGARAG